MKLGLPTGKIGGPRGWAAVLPGPDTAAVAVAGGTRCQTVPLAEVRRQVNPGEQQIVTAIGAEQVFLQVVTLPATEPKEIEQMLALQLDTLSPLPAEELVCGSQPLSKTGNATRLLVGLARKSAVNERVAELENRALPVTVVQVDVLAVFQKYRRAADGKRHVLVYLTGTATSIVVYADEQPWQVRSLLAGDPATINDEVRWALLGAEAATPATAAGTVTFLADTEDRQALAESLRAGWGAGAESIVAGNPLASDLCWAAASGEGTRFNLLPEEWRTRRRAAGVRKLLVRSGIGIGVLYVVALMLGLALIAWRQTQLKKMEQAIRQLQPAHGAARELRGTLRAMEGQLDTKHSGLEVLRTVSELLPEAVKLTGFNFKKEKDVNVRGQTSSAVQANDYIGRLEGSPLFASVKTVSVRTEGSLTKFEVVCVLKSAPVKGTR